MHTMKPICNRRGKKKSLLFNSSTLHFSRPKSHSLFFSRHSPQKGVKDPGQNTAYLKEKNLWHFDVNFTVHCRRLFAFTARKVLWAAELRSTDAKDPNFTSSVNNSGQPEFLQKQTCFGALGCLQSSSINFLFNSFIKHFCLPLSLGELKQSSC